MFTPHKPKALTTMTTMIIALPGESMESSCN